MANAKLCKGNTNPAAKVSFIGSLPMLKLLVEHNANLEMPTSNGNTALMWAAFAGNAHIVEYLLSKDVSLDNHNKDGLDALDLAISRMHYACALLLYNKGAALRSMEEYKPILRVEYDLFSFTECLREKKPVDDASVFVTREGNLGRKGRNGRGPGGGHKGNVEGVRLPRVELPPSSAGRTRRTSFGETAAPNRLWQVGVLREWDRPLPAAIGIAD